MPIDTHVLFVPGVPTDPDDLLALFAALPEGAVGHIVRPPGYGVPATEPGDFDVRARTLRGALEELPEARRWIVGYSAGGFDALRVLEMGAAVDHVVLLNAAFGPENDDDRARFLGLAEAVRTGVFTREMLPPAMLSSSGMNNPACVEATAAWLDAVAPEHLAAELRSYAQQRSLESVVAAHADRITIVHAEFDQSIPFAYAKTLAERTGARFVPIEGLGHAACIEDPEATCRALRMAWASLV